MSLNGPPRPLRAKVDIRPFYIVPALLIGGSWVILGLILPEFVLEVSVTLLVVFVLSILISLRVWFLDEDRPHFLSLESDGLWVIWGDRAVLYPYEEVKLIYHPKNMSRYKWFRWAGDWPHTVIQFHGGESLEIPRDIKNHPQFVKNLMQITFPFRYKTYAQVLNSEGKISMGVMVLSEEGLSGRTPYLIPWEKIHAVYLWQNQLRYRPMEQFGNPTLCQLTEVVDLDVLFSLSMSLATRRRRMA